MIPSPTSQDYGDISHVAASITVSGKAAKFIPSVTLQSAGVPERHLWSEQSPSLQHVGVDSPHQG